MERPRQRWLMLVLLACVLLFIPAQVYAKGKADSRTSPALTRKMERIKASVESKRAAPKLREEAADRLDAKLQMEGVKADAIPSYVGPGDTPDYSGMTPNWAFSPPLRKFIDSLPGLGADNHNNLGQYISVAKPDTTTYPGCDYYEIALREYTEQMHTDLPDGTLLRGYVQTNNGTSPETGNNTATPDPIHYLGPVIVSQKDRPVRIKFTNELPVGQAGDLFLPVDDTVMGAGAGPLGMAVEPYSQNRAAVHLHGGRTPWISDGHPHEWISPADEDTPYPKGVSVHNVPDMPDPGDGSMTFYYTNQQSARFMFYHDHALGITRLNVYAGNAAGYVIEDPVEKGLVDDGLIPGPNETLPLIVQDKTFVDPTTVRETDPTWNWGREDAVGGVVPPTKGDLWFPHVYMPAQSPYDLSGMNPMGRWHYGPWFWPPTKDIPYPPEPNPYYGEPGQPPLKPGVPDVSMAGEAFMDTMVVNGTAFPYMEVDPKAYRLRILNAADDRFVNLQMYVADETTESVDGRLNTEVKMIAAEATPGIPPDWPTDGRDGGVPDPATMGPDWIQIANEGGFLPAPVVIPNQPVTWNLDPTTFNFGNVDLHSLLVAPAERADVVVDFSAYRGKTLILYNDAPAAFPALDKRLDYYTNSPDMTETGGHWGTEVGFGPNIRTVMQIRVADVPEGPDYKATTLPLLEDAFATTGASDGVFKRSQDPIIIPEARYDTAYDDSFTADPYFRVYDNVEKTFANLNGVNLTLPIQPKAIQDEMGEAFDDYGRMEGKLGTELQNTRAGRMNFVIMKYMDPPTEFMDFEMTPMAPVAGDGTQIWRITHNGVDTHPIHVHAFDAQLINRVGWDNGIRPPDDNELGWKETFRVNPLEDTIIAMRPIAPKTPFGLVDSVRLHDPTMPEGSTEGFTNFDPLTGDPKATPDVNEPYNYGLEYMWHCHILSHEEMEMMRPVVIKNDAVTPGAPVLAPVVAGGGGNQVDWTDPTPVAAPATLGNQANEVGFRVERAVVGAGGVRGPWSVLQTALANAVAYLDASADSGGAYDYRIVAFNAAGETSSNIVRIGTPPAATLSITAPSGPSSVVRYTRYTYNGLLTPLHPAGWYGVRIYKYRRVSGVWRYYAVHTTSVADYSATESRYSARISFSYRGDWRLRAYHIAHTGHTSLYSDNKYVTVH